MEKGEAEDSVFSFVESTQAYLIFSRQGLLINSTLSGP